MFDTFDAFNILNSRPCNCWDFWHCWFSPFQLLRQSATISDFNWSNPKSYSQNLQRKQSKKCQLKYTKNPICHHCKLIKNICTIISPKNAVRSFLLNACNIPVFEQMTPAPSYEPQSSTVRWGQSRRDVSLPVHCTSSIAKVLETGPNWECEVFCP